jgi:hypothetical protein
MNVGFESLGVREERWIRRTVHKQSNETKLQEIEIERLKVMFSCDLQRQLRGFKGSASAKETQNYVA